MCTFSSQISWLGKENKPWQHGWRKCHTLENYCMKNSTGTFTLLLLGRYEQCLSRQAKGRIPSMSTLVSWCIYGASLQEHGWGVTGRAGWPQNSCITTESLSLCARNSWELHYTVLFSEVSTFYAPQHFPQSLRADRSRQEYWLESQALGPALLFTVEYQQLHNH